MAERRTVYSTERPVCRKCGWPESDCRCAATLQSGRASVPAKPLRNVQLRVEKRGSGKSVTVVDRLPDNAEWLGALAKEWKHACGTGGAAGAGAIELQGDQRERLRELIQKRGWTVKG